MWSMNASGRSYCALGQYVETVGPGLRMYFPPIESRYKRPVTQINTYRLSQAMLTEDENIVEVAMSVQYNISSLENYVPQGRQSGTEPA